jgi:hypothetical protein
MQDLGEGEAVGVEGVEPPPMLTGNEKDIGHVHITELEGGILHFEFHWDGEWTLEELIEKLFAALDELRKKGMDS